MDQKVISPWYIDWNNLLTMNCSPQYGPSLRKMVQYVFSARLETEMLTREDMSANRYKYFKWTPKSTRITVQYVLVIPAILAYFAYKQDVCFLINLTIN
jgi:uncharacterized membrane protein YeiB